MKQEKQMCYAIGPRVEIRDALPPDRQLCLIEFIGDYCLAMGRWYSDGRYFSKPGSPMDTFTSRWELKRVNAWWSITESTS